jgi:hypothetical protein
MTGVLSAPVGVARPVARRQHRRAAAVVASASPAADSAAPLPPTTSRRAALLAGVATATMGVLTPSPARAGDVQMVSEYLPPYGGEGGSQYGLRTFTPGPTKTPALRAGTVDKAAPYSFALPPTWREARVANIQSGNYCQPKCEEPWTEVVFESPDEGSARVIVSPLRKLTPRAGPGRDLPIDQVGSLSSVIAALGPFVTGTYLDEEDVLDSKAVSVEGGAPQYLYEVNAPYGAKGVGPHAAVAVAAKGDLAFLFVVSANDKQWAKGAPMLRAVARSFRA